MRPWNWTDELPDTDGYVKPSKQQLFVETGYFIMVTAGHWWNWGPDTPHKCITLLNTW